MYSAVFSTQSLYTKTKRDLDEDVQVREFSNAVITDHHESALFCENPPCTKRAPRSLNRQMYNILDAGE
jgi:hypothetical protein